ncbi:MAG: branched-chain amino acid ABC transporter permease [Bacillota bacterium]|nr:branched-chain amino acid ABC transporter permease [Bacillota bacterium]
MAFVQTLLLGVLVAGVYALMASGLTLIFGVMNIVNVAHGAMLVVSAFVTWALWRATGLDPLLLALATTPLMFGFGWLVHRLLIRRLGGDPATMAVLLTFALAVAVEGLLGLVWSGDYRAVTPSYVARSVRLGPFFLPEAQLYAGLLAVAVLLALHLVLARTRVGWAIRTATENPQLAALVGVDPERVRALAFAIGAATAGAGGSMLSVLYPFSPASHYLWISRLLGIVVLGGMGSLPGAALGALVLGVAETLTSTYVSVKWATGVFYLVIFVVLLLRPQGLLGLRLRQDVPQ